MNPKDPPFPDLNELAEELLDESYELLKTDKSNGFAIRQIAEIRGLLTIPMKFDMVKNGEEYLKLSEEVRMAYARLMEMRLPK